MKVLFLIFSLFSISSIAQIEVFDQEYYSIIKSKTIKFEQKKDKLYITNCDDFQKCDSISKPVILIDRDSVIDSQTRKIVLKNPNYKPNTEEFNEKEIILTEYKNGRKGIEEIYYNDIGKDKKTQLAILYPKSELIKLKPISDITKAELKEILGEFENYIKSLDKENFDYDDFSNWEKFNDLVIKKGYNPIGADIEFKRILE